jgi:hypothetical protein
MNLKINIIFIICLFISLTNINFAHQNLINKFKKELATQISDSTVHKIWEVNNDTSSSFKLIISDNKIYSSLDDGLVYCYDMNGKEKWVAEILGDIQNNLVHYKDLILTSTTSGDLYSINANNGDIVQVIGIGENITTNLDLIDFVTSDSKSKAVVFGTESGTIYCYDIFSFERIWKVKLSQHPILDNSLSIDDKIFFEDSLLNIYSINSKSGSLIWKHEFTKKETENNFNSIQSDGKKIFVLSPSNELVAFDLLLGKVLWTTKKLDIYPQFQLSDDKKFLVTLNKRGEILILSPIDGKEIKKIALDKEKINSFCFDEASDYSLISISDGSIYRINKKFEIQQIVFLDGLEIETLKILSASKFIISTKNGKISLYEFD